MSNINNWDIEDVLREAKKKQLEKSTRKLKCNGCAEDVSTPVPDDTIVRGWIECPKCIEKNNSNIKENLY